MRTIAAVFLIAAGSLFTYWIFLETLASHRGIELDWVFVTAFGWLACYDLWNRFFRRAKPAAVRVARRF